jgi:hypothetical protein
MSDYNHAAYCANVKRVIGYLEQTKALLSDPVKWTQGALARKANGEQCSPFDPEATCFCLIGALQYVSKIDFKELSPEYYIIKNILISKKKKQFQTLWAEINDSGNYKQSINFLSDIIKKLKSKNLS